MQQNPRHWPRELQVLRNALNLAVREWEWLDTTPFLKVKIEVPKNGVERWLTLEEETRLLAACPDWLKVIVSFAINTGMRKEEVLSLQWSQVDLESRVVILVQTKNKEKRTIPLNQAAFEVLQGREKDKKRSAYVFPSERGTKLDGHNLSRAYRKAREDAGILDIRVHDLRHTAGSRMAQSGVDIYTISKVLGHKTLAMAMRYSHHNVESLRHGVEALDKWREKKSAVLLLNQPHLAEKKGLQQAVSP